MQMNVYLLMILDNINACKNVGMDGIHLPDHSKLEEELKEHHII